MNDLERLAYLLNQYDRVVQLHALVRMDMGYRKGYIC